jgi:hypothetical protein
VNNIIPPRALTLNAIISKKGVSLKNALQMKSPVSNNISLCSNSEARGYIAGKNCLHLQN